MPPDNSYDQNGVLIENTQQIFTNNDWVNDYRLTVPAYQDEMNYQEIWEQWESGTWKPATRTTMAVDSAAQQISRLEENWDGAKWCNQWLYLEPLQDTEVFVPVIKRERKKWDEALNGWVNYEQALSTYTSDSTDEYLVQSWQNGTFVNTFRVLSEFEKHNCVFSETQNWENEGWQPSSRRYNVYDERGRCVENEYHLYSENQWISEEKTVSQFDAYDNDIEHEIFRWRSDLGAWEKSTRYTKRYESFTKVHKNCVAAPAVYRLENYPNPFNATTVIEVALPQAGHLELALYNTLGQQCRVLYSGRLLAGSHRFELDAGNLPSGCYLLRLDHETGQLTSMVQLIR